MSATSTDPVQEIISPATAVSTSPDPILEQRKEATKRFNLLFVYLPIIVAAVVALLVFGLVVGNALFGGDGTAQATDSGLADMLVIMFVLSPLAIMGAALVGLAGYLLNWRRKKGSVVRKPLQKATVKVDQLAVTANEKAETAQAAVADKIIQTNSKVSQASALVRNVSQAARETAADIQQKIHGG